MISTAMRRYARAAMATVAVSATVVGAGQTPAFAATAVKGSAFGYYTNVSLFGGPSTLLGYGQAAGAPAVSATPSVTLPSSGAA